MIYSHGTSISKNIYMHNRNIYLPCTSQKSVFNPIPVPAWYGGNEHPLYPGPGWNVQKWRPTLINLKAQLPI
jgi:hypothetical protein